MAQRDKGVRDSFPVTLAHIGQVIFHCTHRNAKKVIFSFIIELSIQGHICYNNCSVI